MHFACFPVPEHIKVVVYLHVDELLRLEKWLTLEWLDGPLEDEEAELEWLVVLVEEAVLRWLTMPPEEEAELEWLSVLLEEGVELE